jgi:hypothetical protein
MSIVTYWKDLFLHNSVFLFLIYQIKTQKFIPSAKYFKNKLIFFLSNTFSDSSSSVSEFIEKNYLIIFQSILAFMTIITLISILRRNKMLLFVHSIIFLILALIVYNPIHPENKIEAHYGFRKELMLSVGIFIVRVMNILDSKNNKVIEEKPRQDKENNSN